MDMLEDPEEPQGMTVVQAMENALIFLEASGYTGGDVHDDLALAITYLRGRFRQAADYEF
jgi:hypothetical protein